MKTSLKKILGIVLSLVIVFSVCSVPASAVNIYEENTYNGLIEVYDYGNKEDKNFFERIADTFHWYIARLFILFDADCPFCGEHFMVPELEHSMEYYYNDAINALKDYKGKVKIEKKRTVAAEVTDVSSVVAAITDPIAESLSGTTTDSYSFVAGVTADGKKITDVVQPLGRKAEITEEGVYGSFARYEYVEENTTAVKSLSINLVSETARFDGTAVTQPIHNSSIIEPINPGALELGPLIITEADINYPVTSAGIEFDDEGRISTLLIEIPVESTFTGNVASISFKTSCQAEITEEYTVTYVS